VTAGGEFLDRTSSGRRKGPSIRRSKLHGKGRAVQIAAVSCARLHIGGTAVRPRASPPPRSVTTGCADTISTTKGAAAAHRSRAARIARARRPGSSAHDLSGATPSCPVAARRASPTRVAALLPRGAIGVLQTRAVAARRRRRRGVRAQLVYHGRLIAVVAGAGLRASKVRRPKTPAERAFESVGSVDEQLPSATCAGEVPVAVGAPAFANHVILRRRRAGDAVDRNQLAGCLEHRFNVVKPAGRRRPGDRTTQRVCETRWVGVARSVRCRAPGSPLLRIGST
jgi:hypothetical protein